MSLFLPCSYSQFIGVSNSGEYISTNVCILNFVFTVPFSAVMIYTYYHGIIDHSGITFKKAFWQPWQPDCIFHDNHHQYFHVNFGFNIELWDKVYIENFLAAHTADVLLQFADFFSRSIICFRFMGLIDKKIEFTAKTSFMAMANPSVMLLTRNCETMWRKEPQKIQLPIKETNSILSYLTKKSRRKKLIKK